jgi:hypothetical protein
MGNDSHSLLFIPDISGFTKFVTATEIEHSQHIIAELLEIIIDSNELGLTVSEIEGDAVLFYEYKNVPALDKILSQTRKMFLAFHGQLVGLEKHRVCDCGACSTASRLTLKIVAHAGNFTLIKVKDRQKPYGPDVILVHRLLKNNIDNDEYLLITDNSFASITDNDLDTHREWARLETGSCSYESLGEINYKYIPLSPLLDYMPEPDPVPEGKKIANPVVVEEYIESPVDTIFEALRNLALRPRWTRGLERIEFDEDKLNVPGTKHKCVIDSKELDFETVIVDFGKTKRVYGERVANAPFMKDMYNYIILEPQGAGTKLRAETHFFPLPLIGRLLKPLLTSKLTQNLTNAMNALKEYCESRKAA